MSARRQARRPSPRRPVATGPATPPEVLHVCYVDVWAASEHLSAPGTAAALASAHQRLTRARKAWTATRGPVALLARRDTGVVRLCPDPARGRDLRQQADQLEPPTEETR